MAVYVDNMNASFRRMTMCHMVADTTEELLAMADKIGVARRWIQEPGTALEHFDICLTKKARALKHGAIEVSMMELGRFTCARSGGPFHEEGVVPPPPKPLAKLEPTGRTLFD